MINKPNTAEEMLTVLQAYIDGKELEFCCVLSDEELEEAKYYNQSVADTGREWSGCRNDIPAHDLFTFKTHAYRAAK